MSSKQRIGRQKITLALVHAAGANNASAAVALNGILLQAIIKTPAAVDGSATTKIEIFDADNNVIYTKSGIAVNTTVFDIPATVTPLSGTESVKVTYSANQTVTDTTTTVVLMIDRG